MNKKTNRRKKLFIILGIIAVLLIAGVVSLNQVVSRLVKKELTNQLNSDPGSLYHITIDKIKVNLFNGSLSVRGVTVTPTDSAYSILHEGKVNKLLHVRLPRFLIREMGIMKFIRESYIEIAEVDLLDLEVDYLINTEAKAPENKNSFILHNIFSKNFKGATVGAINISAELLRFFHVDRKDSSFMEVDSLQLRIQEISLTPETISKPIPLSFRDIQINTGSFALKSMKYYTIALRDVRLDVLESMLVIDGFRLIPKYSREEYNKAIRYNNDWFSISTRSIRLSDVNLEELEFDKILDFGSLVIEGADINIYRDKRLPDAPFKYKPLLGGLVRKIPLELNVDSIMILDGKLSYQEQTDASDQPGTVFFEPLELRAYHVTNSPDRIESNPVMEVDFRGKIMGASLLNARLQIDLASTQEEFSINGTLEPVSGTAFNPMVEHLLPVKIMSADVSKTAFHFTANDDLSHGELIMEYDNLSVEVLKHKNPEKKAGLISVVANGLIHGKNLPDHHKYHTGTIRFERRKDKAIVNFLWNSCKTGIISIVAPIADKNKKIERQEAREEKKEERKQEKGKKKDHNKK